MKNNLIQRALFVGSVIVAAVSVVAAPTHASARTWYVDGAGGKDFVTIQAAIDAAVP